MITFKDVIPWLISFGSVLFAWWTNNKKDIKDSAVVVSTVTQQITDLKEKLNERLSEINITMRGMIEDSKDHGERITVIEVELKNLKREIDQIKKEHKD